MDDEPKLSRPIIGPPELYKGRSERLDAVLLFAAVTIIVGIVVAAMFLTQTQVD